MTLFVLFFPASGFLEPQHTEKQGKCKNDKSTLVYPPTRGGGFTPPKSPTGLFILSATNLVIFFFPYNPDPSPSRQTPPGRPTRKGLISVHFGPVWLRSALFGSVWLRFGSVPGPFRVRFGSIGWGRGGVGERGFCKGKNITKLIR